MCRLLLTAAILFAFCPLAGAKEKSEQAKQLAVAQKAMKRLAFMQGRWGGVETHLPSDYMPKGGSFKAMAKTTSLYKGVHLTVSQTSYTRPVKYEAHGLWSYDAKTQEYVLTWFDSMGGLDRYRGKFSEDGKRLNLGQRRGEVGYSVTYIIHDVHHYTFEMAIQKGDQRQKLITAEYTRAGKGPRLVDFGCRCGKHKQKPLGSKAPS